LKIKLIEKSTGKIIDETTDIFHDTLYRNLLIGLNGKVYDVGDWSNDYTGGADFEDVTEEFDIEIIA
jgi:hypothetical protein